MKRKSPIGSHDFWTRFWIRWKRMIRIGPAMTNDRSKSVPTKLLTMTQAELSTNTGDTNTIQVAGSAITNEMA